MDEWNDSERLERELADPTSDDPLARTARRLHATAGLLTSSVRRHAAWADARDTVDRPKVVRPAYRRAVSMAAALFLVASGTIALGAQNAKPGELLWDVRRVRQAVRLAMAGDPTDRISLLLARAEGEVSIAEDALDGGDLSVARAALSAADTDLDDAEADLAEADANPEFVQRIATVRRQHEAAAEGLDDPYAPH